MFKKQSELQVGDVIVVYGAGGWSYTPIVEAITYEPDTARTRIDLCWGEHGKSKVYAHDELKTWSRIIANAAVA